MGTLIFFNLGNEGSEGNNSNEFINELSSILKELSDVELPEFQFEEVGRKQTIQDFDTPREVGATLRGTLPSAVDYFQLFYTDDFFRKVDLHVHHTSHFLINI